MSTPQRECNRGGIGIRNPLGGRFAVLAAVSYRGSSEAHCFPSELR